MRSGRPKPPICLAPEERQQLQALTASRSRPHGLVQRAQIVVLAAAGFSNTEIARRLHLSMPTVGLWRQRYLQEGLAGLHDELRPGRPRSVSDEQVAHLIRRTLKTKPRHATHWTVRSIADETGLSKSTVHRIWEAFGFQPHRQRHFQLSTDPFFVEKVRDIIGLYLHPPDKALVLCVDEKSQIQALERTQPILPMGLGYVEGVTHNYWRHGTSTLFAALEVLQGKVVGQCHQRHRHQEFLKFLRTLDQEFPGEIPLHLVIDNYGTHKHENVRNWLKRHPRFVLHFVPTSSSWLNLVERWFGQLDQKAIRRGVFRSVEDLEAAIDAFLTAWNQDPKPFVWTATVESILEKLSRCRQTLEKIQPGCTSPRTKKRKK